MDSSTKRKGDKCESVKDTPTPSLRPPIFCPLCGSEHRFYNAFAEQVFVIDRLVRMQKSESCSAKIVSVAIPGTPDTLGQARQRSRAQQPSKSAEIPLTCPHAVLVSVMDYLAPPKRPTNQPSQDRDESPRDAAATNPAAPDTNAADEDPIQDQLLAHNSPNLSEASLQHLDESPTVPDPNRPRRGSMPPEGDIRRLALWLGRPRPSGPRHTESLPDIRKDWDAYDENNEDWEDFASDEAEAGSAPGSRAVESEELPSVEGLSSPTDERRGMDMALAKFDVMVAEAMEKDPKYGGKKPQN